MVVRKLSFIKQRVFLQALAGIVKSVVLRLVDESVCRCRNHHHWSVRRRVDALDFRSDVPQLTLFPRWSRSIWITAWEQRKLGELCIISKGHGYSKADIRDAGTPLILYGRLYTQYESRIEDVDTFAVEQEGSLLSKGDEVIVPASGETAEDIAVASSVRRSGIIFGGDLNVVTPVSKLDPDYTALAITYSKAHDDLAKRAQGKSVVHVHGNDIAEVEIPYPSESEQKRISTVILGLDNLITLHQRKCQYRSLCGYLSWEQRKLGDCVGSTYGGGTPSTSHGEYWGGDIPWIQSSNVLENELFRIDIPKAITQEGLSKSAALQVPGDSIAVVTHVGVGKLVYLPFSYATSQDFVSLSELKGDANFLCYAIQRKLQSELHMVQGSAIKGITKEELLGKAISLPAVEEQKLVGNQMRAIDSLITLHQ